MRKGVRFFNVAISLLGIGIASSGNAAESSRRLQGALEAGPATFISQFPSTDFTMEKGLHLALEGQKSTGIFSFHVVGSLLYMSTSGKANYYYVGSLSTYEVSQIAHTTDFFEGSLGIKFYFFEWPLLRVFAEAGGQAGYLQIKYASGLSDGYPLTGGDMRTFDTAIDSGIYFAAGLEFFIFDGLGIKLTARYQDNFTRPLDTLNKRMVHHAMTSFLGGVAFRF